LFIVIIQDHQVLNSLFCFWAYSFESVVIFIAGIPNYFQLDGFDAFLFLFLKSCAIMVKFSIICKLFFGEFNFQFYNS
jgi:hypothetical protein